jgi:hypothetical protein
MHEEQKTTNRDIYIYIYIYISTLLYKSRGLIQNSNLPAAYYCLVFYIYISTLLYKSRGLIQNSNLPAAYYCLVFYIYMTKGYYWHSNVYRPKSSMPMFWP